MNEEWTNDISVNKFVINHLLLWIKVEGKMIVKKYNGQVLSSACLSLLFASWKAFKFVIL